VLKLKLGFVEIEIASVHANLLMILLLFWLLAVISLC